MMDLPHVPPETVNRLEALAKMRGSSVAALLDEFVEEAAPSDNSLMYYQALFNNVRDAILVVDNDMKYIDANPAACNLLGYSRDELLQLTIQDLTDASQKPDTSAEWDRFVQGGRYRLEYRMRHKDGTPIDVEVESVHHFVPGRSVAIIRDNRAHKRIETELKEQRDFLQTIFDRIDSSISVVDVTEENDYIYASVNPAQSRAIGIPAEEIVGRRPEDVVQASPEVAARLRARFQQCVEERQAIVYEYVVETEAAPASWLAQLFPLFDENGRVYRLVAFKTDITERQRIQAIQQELEKGHEIQEFKTRVFSMFTHEFNTPLSVIASSIDLLRLSMRSNRLTDDMLRGRLEIMRGQVDHLARIAMEISRLNRLDTYRHRANMATVNVQEFLSEIVDEQRIGASGEVYLDVGKYCSEITIDVDLFEQIVVNLLSNAIKYSKDNGDVYVFCNCTTSQVDLTIKDEGIGIPEADREKLFDLFERASNVGKRPGTGVGLATVKRALEILDGTLEMESEEGVGTSFTVTLPLDATA